MPKHSFIVNSSFESKREAHAYASSLAVSALFLFESNFKGNDKSRWSAFSACDGCRGNAGSNLIQDNSFEYYGEEPEIGWLQFG